MSEKRIVFVSAALAAILVLVGCGGGQSSGSAAAKPAEPAGPTPAEQGRALGQEIIAAFDGLVAETTQKITENPDAEPKMAELNGRLMALRAADIEAFGACNSAIQELRPQSAHAMDVAFAPFLMDYPGADPNGEVKEFLSGKPLIRLLDLATEIH